MALNTLSQAFIKAWCFLSMLMPNLNIHIQNWSQHMPVLKGYRLWKGKNPPLIRTEINGGLPKFLIHVFTLTCLLPHNV